MLPDFRKHIFYINNLSNESFWRQDIADNLQWGICDT